MIMDAPEFPRFPRQQNFFFIFRLKLQNEGTGGEEISRVILIRGIKRTAHGPEPVPPLPKAFHLACEQMSLLVLALLDVVVLSPLQPLHALPC